MTHLQKSRVTVDFPTDERDVLQELCDQDIRPAQEQLRWLVLNEAKRRGLQITLTNSKSAPTLTEQGAFASITR